MVNVRGDVQMRNQRRSGKTLGRKEMHWAMNKTSRMVRKHSPDGGKNTKAWVGQFQVAQFR